MKKILFRGLALLSFIAVLASGCARETIESKNDKPIKFTAVAGKQTRASEFIYWTPGQSINVWSFGQGSTALFRQFTLTYGGGGFSDWTYGTPILQPGVPLVFYSIYPENNITNVNLNGISGSFSYSVQLDDTDQEDLIAATTMTDSHLVGLNFEHLLSQVNFAIWGLAGIQYEVTNIRLTGIAESGDYTFGSEWSNQSGGAEYLYRPSGGIDRTNGTDDEILFLGNNPGDNTNDNALMLIPQSFSSPGISFVNFDYTIYDMNGTPLFSSSDSIDLSTLNISMWEAGRRYIYLIDFRGENIEFLVDVLPWIDGGIIDVMP